jgi:membrane protein
MAGANGIVAQPDERSDDQRGHGSVLLEVVRAVLEEIPSDHVLMVAAGLAYHAVFGLLPALAAAAALWGRLGGFGALKRSMESSQGLLPPGAVQLLGQFVTGVPEGFGTGGALLLNLGIVVLTSQRAASGLLTALNIAYDVAERRGRLRRAAVTVVIGLCGIALLFAALALMALPPWLAPHLPSPIVEGLLWLRWPALALAFTLGLGLLFRYAPSRDRLCWGCIIRAAAAATALWIVASAGVSLYAAHVASFGRFYGSLGSVAVVLLWFYASALAVLAGAEIDAALTARAHGRPRSRLKSELRRFERRTAPSPGDRGAWP